MNAPARREQKCYRCGAAVIWANLDGGSVVAVEKCAPGRGNVAFQRSLIASDPERLVSARGSTWRKHRCPKAGSFSTMRGKKAR